LCKIARAACAHGILHKNRDTAGADAGGKVTIVPRDCTFLPLSSGALLVSRDHAVFCRVPPGEVDGVRAVVGGEAPLEGLSPAMRDGLEWHGFFGPPRRAKPNAPSVQLQLTNECNLACAYCCTNSGKPRTLASEIVRLGLGLTIFTNGLPLADDDLAERMARLTGGGAQVRVSLGGPSMETCDPISGAGRFEAALHGVQKLAAFGGRAAVDLMLTPQHVEAISGQLPGLRERLPPHTPVALGVLYLSGRETGQHLFGSRAELEAALDRVAFEAGVAIPASLLSPVTYRREGCGCALGKHVHVRSDGALFNCFKMEEQVGHLDTVGFAAAARSIRENPHRASDLPACAGCPLATLCGGGCRSENLLYTGNADEPACGPWRVRVISELLAEDHVTAVEWPVPFLLQEAHVRGIEVPRDLRPRRASRHLVDV
jgi:radical SAM protein with 4Fe4S-binding SPASM domain